MAELIEGLPVAHDADVLNVARLGKFERPWGHSRGESITVCGDTAPAPMTSGTQTALFNRLSRDSLAASG